MASLKDHNNLTVFKQHGFIYHGETATQVHGFSIFSGKNKFWINPVTKQWDCKHTGKSGGYQEFLKAVHDFSVENFKGLVIGKLKRDRGIQRTTFLSHKIGYNPYTEDYIIPVFDANNDKIWDMRMYNPRKKKMIGTSGCLTGIYGWDEISAAKKIWLCEGEWDKLAMWEILKKTNRLGDEVAVSVPGANTFKNDWAQLFKGKEVVCVYDHDLPKVRNKITVQGAGPLGCVKVYKNIKSITKKLSFVNWPDDSADGFDVRDLLNNTKSHATTYTKLNSYVQKEPPIDGEVKEELIEDDKSDEDIFTGPRITAKEVYEKYKKWLHLPDTDVLDVMFGSIIANRLDGDPLWMFLVAPSGATKTELLMSISDAPRISSTTSLTPHSLVSGANYAGGGDPSLIPRLDKKVLVIKDFTTILDMNPLARQEILGILRDAYDGKTEKMFGNGVFRSYNSKFGLLAGTTPAIELAMAEQTAVGERFLRYNVPIPKSLKEQKEYLKRAAQNVKAGPALRQELAEMGNAVLSHNYKNPPPIPPDIQNKFIVLAQWTSIMRGTIIRDTYSKEVLAAPFKELGTRLVKQYSKLGLGIGMFRGVKKLSKREFATVRDISLGSVPGDLVAVTEYLFKNTKNEYLAQKDILEKTRLPYETGKRKLENLVMLGVLEKRKVKMSHEYKIKDEIVELIEEGDLY